MKKLNLRLILLHVCGGIFFMLAINIFSYFYDMPFMNDFLGKNNLTSKELIEKHWKVFPLVLTWTGISPVGGLLIAFLLSLLISIKKHIHWLNSILVAAILLLIYYWALNIIYPLKPFLLLPFNTFNDWFWAFIINGLIMLALGLFTFFNPRINRIILR